MKLSLILRIFKKHLLQAQLKPLVYGIIFVKLPHDPHPRWQAQELKSLF